MLYDELLGDLRSLDIVQSSCEWEEDIPSDIFNKYFWDENLKKIRYRNVGEFDYSWDDYCTYGEVIVEYEGRYLGIDFITRTYGGSSYSDCMHTLEFREVKPVKVEKLEYHAI